MCNAPLRKALCSWNPPRPTNRFEVREGNAFQSWRGVSGKSLLFPLEDGECKQKGLCSSSHNLFLECACIQNFSLYIIEILAFNMRWLISYLSDALVIMHFKVFFWVSIMLCPLHFENKRLSKWWDELQLITIGLFSLFPFIVNLFFDFLGDLNHIPTGFWRTSTSSCTKN